LLVKGTNGTNGGAEADAVGVAVVDITATADILTYETPMQ